MAESESNLNPRKFVVRDILLVLFGVLVDRTVTYLVPSLLPVLPYGWLLVLVWLTRELIDKTQLRMLMVRAYSWFGAKYRMFFYLILFVLGGLLLCGYGLAVTRVFRRAPQNQNQGTTEI